MKVSVICYEKYSCNELIKKIALKWLVHLFWYGEYSPYQSSCEDLTLADTGKINRGTYIINHQCPTCISSSYVRCYVKILFYRQ